MRLTIILTSERYPWIIYVTNICALLCWQPYFPDRSISPIQRKISLELWALSTVVSLITGFLCVFFLKYFSSKNQYLLTPPTQALMTGNTNSPTVSLRMMLIRTIQTCSSFWEYHRMAVRPCSVMFRPGNCVVISIAIKQSVMPDQISSFWLMWCMMRQMDPTGLLWYKVDS